LAARFHVSETNLSFKRMKKKVQTNFKNCLQFLYVTYFFPDIIAKKGVRFF